MLQKADIPICPIEERRGRGGVWPWFALNVILFPAPSHVTLLRVREFGFGKIIRHLAVTFLLVSVLLVSAGLQVVFPGIGPLWMVFPALSGVAVLAAGRSFRSDFKPMHIAALDRSRIGFVLTLVLLYSVITFLPFLDLIELNREPPQTRMAWIGSPPDWQTFLLISTGLFLLLTGYAFNADGPLSVNRTVILYTCFITFHILILVVLIISYEWLKVQGGFTTHLAMVLLAAILALDYWDADTFGQYARRFFFLTFSKGITFLFLWLCLLGLPQKSAAAFSDYAFNGLKSALEKISPRYLIFTDRNRFSDGHLAARRLRALYAKAFIESGPENPVAPVRTIAGPKSAIFPPDADISLLTHRIGEEAAESTSIDFAAVPFFRPVQSDWDVMLTALLAQKAISVADLDRHIADFKSGLPPSARGRLPDIDALHHARYVSLATGTRVDFLPPRFDLVETLLALGFHPLLHLRLDGEDTWAAILHLDREARICWLRIETGRKMEASIQLRFDAGMEAGYKNDILSRIVAPISLEHLRGAMRHGSEPMAVFSRHGLHEALPDLFSEADLTAVNRAVAFAADPVSWPDENPDTANPFSAYAGYLRTIATAKAMLDPKSRDRDLFDRPAAESPVDPEGPARLLDLEARLARIAPLRDGDRMEIASLLVRHFHHHRASELFLRMAGEKPFSSDLIPCEDAFRIGRGLFLLGEYPAANRYLSISFLRHPFHSEYEMWRQIAGAKLGHPLEAFGSPPALSPDLYRYYRTVVDIRNGKEASARRRLEKALEKDSHDSLAHHLLNQYFGRDLNEDYFYPAPKGL